MTEIEVTARAKRVGNSLAVIIPAAEARRAGIQEGSPVRAVISTQPTRLLGLLKDLHLPPFDRREEGLWRDRV